MCRETISQRGNDLLRITQEIHGRQSQYLILSSVFKKVNVKVSVAQSCPTLCDPMDCSPPSSSAHGILQARILEWVAMSFSRGSSQPRDQTQVFCIARRFFTI